MKLGKGILAAVMAVFLSFSMIGCSGKGPITIDGKVDVVEAQIIQVAVGVAMASKPEMVKPVYDISGKLLNHVSETDATTPSLLKMVLSSEIDKLNVDPLTRQSIYDLVGLIEAQIIREIGEYNLDDKIIIISQVIQIVHNTAEQRIKYIESLEKEKNTIK